MVYYSKYFLELLFFTRLCAIMGYVAGSRCHTGIFLCEYTPGKKL